MEKSKKYLAREQAIEDIKRSFHDFIVKGNPKEINTVWQILHHAKQEEWFDEEYFRYWLIKCINTLDAQGAYVLCLPAITNKICGLNPRKLGCFLTPRIDFIVAINEFPKALNIINYATQGSAVFEKAWLVNMLEHIGVEDKLYLLQINSKNEAIDLNNSL